MACLNKGTLNKVSLDIVTNTYSIFLYTAIGSNILA